MRNISQSVLGVHKKGLILLIILSSAFNCIAWPSAILGLLPNGGGKNQQVLFPPPGNSNPSPTVDSESSNCFTAGFAVSPRNGILTSESGTSSSFSVKLNCAPTSEVEIKINSSNTSEITTGLTSLIFTKTNWSVEQVVNLTGIDDTLQDGNKTVTIDLGSGISNDTNYNNLSAGTVEAVNADNETTGITVSALGGHIVTEAGGTSSFTIVLNSAPSGDVAIPVISSDLTEGTVSPSSITFTNSDWNIPQTIIVTGVDDPNPDGNINFSVGLGPSTSSDANYNGLSQPNISVTNEDNDSAGFTIINPTITTNESGTSGVFFVVLNSPPVANVSLPLTNLNTTEGSISTTNLTFTTSSWNIQQAVTVTGLDDFALDGNITYQIQVGAPVSSDAAYNSISPQSVTVTNMDNDSSGFDITTISSNTSEALNTATFKVRLITVPSANVSITFSSSDTTEGTIQSGSSLTFTSANWNTYQTVTINGVNDSLGDGDITYSIISNPAVSADATYNGLDPADITVINEDNDTPGVTLFVATNPLITTESAGKATFTVKLRTKPAANVTLTGITSSNTSAGTVSPANITFTSTNWSVPQTVTITGVNNDYLNPSGILYSITVPSPTSTDTTYNSLPTNTVNVKNNDNDTQGYTVSKTKNFITADSNKSDSFTIRLNTQPVGGDVVIPVNSANAAEVVVSPSVLTFTAANWNIPQTVTITGQVDGVSDGSKLVTIALGTPTAASGNKDYYPDATGSDYSSVKLPDYNSAFANNGMITISNCDSDAKIAVCLPQVSERVTSESGTSFQYYVLLGQLPTGDVTFNVSVSDTNEATVSTATVTKTAANWDTIQFITVTGKNDPALETIGQQLDGAKLYNIIHSAATSTDIYYNGFDVADITNITNTDPDVPNIIMSPTSSSSSRITLVNNTSVTVSIRLNAQPTANTSFTLTGAGFTAIPASLTFTSADWNMNQNLTISYSGGIGNKQLVTSAFTSLDAKFNGKAVLDIFFTIVQPGFTVSAISGNTDETGTTKTFTVKLNSPPSANVSIDLVSTNTGEVTILSAANLTFTPANWNTNQTVTVQGVDDTVLDGDQSIIIQLLAATSADTSYEGLDPNDVTVINLDND